MSAVQVAILAVATVLVNLLKQGRSLALLGVSALAIFWLQLYQEPVNLVFWFPVLTLALTVISWLLTSTPESRSWKGNWGAVLVLSGVVLFIALNRYFQIPYIFITNTPRVQLVLAVLFAVILGGFVLVRIKVPSRVLFMLAVIALVALLALMKTPSAMEGLIEAVAGLRGKEAGEVVGLAWLGFSYVAFRLLHTILDRRAGRLPPVQLAEYANYVIFFPSFTAGPIDRLERFIRDLNEPVALDQDGWTEAGTRLFFGLLKKFILADGLAWFALTDVFAVSVRSAGWMWLMLYAYSLRIYFDFSGYTDIAIGLGRLLGVRLPENFNAPYLKPNLTQFWNSWHMTLTQWFRSYFFNPLTRAMRSAKKPLPQPLMILFAQTATMVLIGLWHGVTPGFLAWGLWHGAGLFVHNRWSDWIRAHPFARGGTPWGVAVIKFSGMFITFHYVTIGWLFFFLPDPRMAWDVMLKLFGVP